MTVEEAAVLYGVGRRTAYAEIKETGQLGGVDVIKLGRRILLPQAKVYAVLGLTSDHEPS